MMEDKTRAMHVSQRAPKKKLKHDETSLKSPGIGKRKNDLLSPILVAFNKNSENRIQAACNISNINTLQARKKRKAAIAADTAPNNTSKESEPLTIV
jgi:hypothetical protein